MSDVRERSYGELRVRIDRTLCVGFGDCVTEAPEVFALDDGDLTVFVEGDGRPDRARLEAAWAACPVDALALVDGDATLP